jgi:glycosyltransferase involved in cell wall biosynthesis
VPDRAANPAVSIIMPAHNTAPYVGAAVRSALVQTFGDFELILVDDGSSDDTVDVALRAARGDSRLKVVRRPTAEGASAARNSGLAVARGEFIALLDSDDEWSPEFLAVQLAAFASFPDVAIVNANAVSVGGPFDGRPYRTITDGCRRVSFLDMIEDEDRVSIMSMFRRTVYERLGGFDVSLPTNEDYEFWLRAAVAGFAFVQTPEPLVRYRRRAHSLSSDELRMLDGIVTVLTRARGWCGDGSRERRAIDRQIQRFQRDALRIRAKVALRARQFHEAARHFDDLHTRYPAAAHTAMAVMSRWSPRSLWWVDRVRSAMRHLGARRLLSSAP